MCLLERVIVSTVKCQENFPLVLHVNHLSETDYSSLVHLKYLIVSGVSVTVSLLGRHEVNDAMLFDGVQECKTKSLKMEVLERISVVEKKREREIEKNTTRRK